jgi:uncharacterized protein (DUF58 family)
MGIPVAIVTTLAGSPWFFVAYDIVLFCIAYATSRMAPSAEDLKIQRKHDPVLSVRADNRIELFVENEGRNTFVGLIRDEPPASYASSEREFPIRLAPRTSATFSYTVSPPERGSDKFRSTFLRLDCPLGLVRRQLELDTSEPIRVYPNVLALREFDLLNQKGRLREVGIRLARARGLGTEFESLRDYAEGDDYRKIDWKASARRGRWITRQYEQERNQCVMLCIDVGRYMLAEVNGVRKLDHVLDAILMLTNAAAASGDLVGALVYSDVVRRYIPPRKGRSQIAAIIEAIHDLVAEPIQSDDAAAFAYLATRWKRRSLIVLFTDFDDVDRARQLAGAFAPISKRHLSLLVQVQDPLLDELVKSAPENVAEMYRQSAATILLDDRQAATRIVTGMGIHTLVSEPQQLASKLVTHYFTVKERALL